jgi:hypothetical protein
MVMKYVSHINISARIDQTGTLERAENKLETKDMKEEIVVRCTTLKGFQTVTYDEGRD